MVTLEEAAKITQKVTGVAKQIKFKDTVFNPLKEIEEVQTGKLTRSFPANSNVLASSNRYAAIVFRAERYVEHERHFRVTFWALFAYFSALALGVYSVLSFLLYYLNTYESERAMIQELYQQQSEPNDASNPVENKAESMQEAVN